MRIRPLFTTLALLLLLAVTAARADVIHGSDSGAMDLYGVHVHIGDVISVQLAEQITVTSAHDNTDTKTNKLDTTTNRGILGIFSAIIPAQNGSMATANKSDHSYSLSMTLGVRIVKVEEASFDVEGKRDMVVNGEKIVVVMHATASKADLTSTNLISSTKLADVTLRVEGLPKKKSDDMLRRIFNMIL